MLSACLLGRQTLVEAHDYGLRFNIRRTQIQYKTHSRASLQVFVKARNKLYN